jgi:hypothetical protein
VSTAITATTLVGGIESRGRALTGELATQSGPADAGVAQLKIPVAVLLAQSQTNTFLNDGSEGSAPTARQIPGCIRQIIGDFYGGLHGYGCPYLILWATIP